MSTEAILVLVGVGVVLIGLIVLVIVFKIKKVKDVVKQAIKNGTFPEGSLILTGKFKLSGKESATNVAKTVGVAIISGFLTGSARVKTYEARRAAVSFTPNKIVLISGSSNGNYKGTLDEKTVYGTELNDKAELVKQVGNSNYINIISGNEVVCTLIVSKFYKTTTQAEVKKFFTENYHN